VADDAVHSNSSPARFRANREKEQAICHFSGVLAKMVLGIGSILRVLRANSLVNRTGK
jgi:hypothetical protein